MSSHVSTAGAEHDLSRKVQELEFELTEARRQQAATADVLKVISRSKFDLGSVLEALVENATRLAAADAGLLARADGELFRIVAGYGASPDVHEYWRRNVIRPGRGAPIGRAALERRTVHIVDLLADPEYDLQEAQRIHGGRSVLAVPMVRQEELIGVFFIYRTIVQAFTEKQIKLITTFAEQAVIAIENTRLFEAEQIRTKELQESLEYQTATSEVLGVISRSPDTLQPVLDGIVATALRLCDARNAAIVLQEGGVLRLRAKHGPMPMRTEWPVGDRSLLVSRAVHDCRTQHIPDLASAGDEFPEGQRDAIRDGIRSILAVPLVREERSIGTIVVRRTEVKPFTDRQISLLQTFADQAVIAINNVGLFEEVQEKNHALTEANAQVRAALERETASSEILRVIGSSPTDVQPVFEAIARSGVSVCGALGCVVLVVDGSTIRVAATHGVRPERLERFHRDYPMRLSAEIDTAQTIRYRRMFHLADIENNPNATADDIENARLAGYRTRLMVPMVRGDRTLGLIAVTREDPTPFPDQLVELLRTFADQAVIAIENARLFEEVRARTKELQGSLDRQTATSEVLAVISRSPNEVQAVLDTIVETAQRLCQAERAIVWRLEGETFRAVAHHGLPQERVETVLSVRMPLSQGSMVGRATLARRALQVEDVATDPELAAGHAFNLAGNVHTSLAVPLLLKGEPIGAITLTRTRVAPFDDKQVALIESFADQAVIAVQNSRLFEAELESKRELTEALEQQTATADVLKVISRSALDLQKVLDALVESAARLCNAYDAAIFQLFGDSLRLVAHHGKIPLGGPVGQYTVPLMRERMYACAVIDRRTIQVADILAEADEYPESRKFALQLGWRTALCVPLVHANKAIGVIFIRRAEVRPFAQRQIELVNTFADQAVIAIENTRLFEEVQARTRELTESLEQQTATSDILRVIAGTPDDAQPVFDAIAQSALRLFGVSHVAIMLREGDGVRCKATAGIADPRGDFLIPLERNSTSGRAILDRAVISISDTEATDAPSFARESGRVVGFRAMAVAPMLREGTAIGSVHMMRQTPGPFTNTQIELLKTFADQAVIAIENVRLFDQVQLRTRELARSVEELQALGEVGRAVSSTLDLKVVLKTIVERAVQLSGTDAGSIFYYHKELGTFELGETTGLSEEFVARLRKLDISAKETGPGEAIARRQPLQVPDLMQRPREPLRDAVLEAGFRASLLVPLLSANGPLGTLILRRRRPGEFSPAVVSLMQSFADQSAIALENARLFDEIAQKSRELEIASQHKSQFVANMSHELRTPLAAILGYAELMQEGFYEPLGPKSSDALTRIRSNGKHLLGLINTVLDIAKIESGQFNLNLGEYALENVVETVRAATEALAETKKLGLKTEVAKLLPIGVGDEQRLTQVLLNLVGNAIKFTDAGEVHIIATASSGHFALSVTDTGPGIPQEHQARIFEQFHQVDSSNTKAKGGTGLGLAIAKQIVEMHGGRIWVESTPGRGATFRMELPTRAEFRKITP